MKRLRRVRERVGGAFASAATRAVATRVEGAGRKRVRAIRVAETESVGESLIHHNAQTKTAPDETASSPRPDGSPLLGVCSLEHDDLKDEFAVVVLNCPFTTRRPAKAPSSLRPLLPPPAPFAPPPSPSTVSFPLLLRPRTSTNLPKRQHRAHQTETTVRNHAPAHRTILDTRLREWRTTRGLWWRCESGETGCQRVGRNVDREELGRVWVELPSENLARGRGGETEERTTMFGTQQEIATGVS